MTVLLSALAGAGSQFFDANGTPLAGGKLYTYAAGSTTPIVTFTDSSGVGANTNPIIFDSAGRPPAQVWLTKGNVYKFVLTTSADVQIWSQDNIPAVNDITNVAWADITGTPTTLAGYGITDALTDVQIAAIYAPKASPAFTGTATASDDSGAQQTIGWRDAPQTFSAINYTLVLADRGKSVVMNGSSLTLTIPANATVAFPIGAVIPIVNLNASALSIAITTDTLTLANSTTTGTRTLARNALASALKVTATSWIISGVGLS